MTLASTIATYLAEALDRRGLAEVRVGTVQAVDDTDPVATVTIEDDDAPIDVRYLAGVQPREGDRVQIVDVGGSKWILGRLASVPGEGPFSPGFLMPTASSEIPSGWLRADGSTHDTADYPRLAEALGQGGSTFTVPDYRGKVLVGAGSGFALGASGGTAAATMPEHNHGPTGDHVHTLRAAAVAAGSGVSAYQPIAGGNESSSGVSGSDDHTHTTQGSSESTANYPPYATAHVLVKT